VPSFNFIFAIGRTYLSSNLAMAKNVARRKYIYLSLPPLSASLGIMTYSFKISVIKDYDQSHGFRFNAPKGRETDMGISILKYGRMRCDAQPLAFPVLALISAVSPWPYDFCHTNMSRFSPERASVLRL